MHASLKELGLHPRAAVGMQGLVNIVVAPQVLAWFIALKEAANLVSDSVLETMKHVHASVDEGYAVQWDELVVPGIIKFIKHTLPTLTEGFADGLLAIWTGFWVLSTGWLCHYLSAEGKAGASLLWLPLCYASGVVPLLLAKTVAKASSDCDRLIVANHNLVISCLEKNADHGKAMAGKTGLMNKAMKGVNGGQGLGFVMGRTVLDTPKLKSLFLKFNGYLGALLPVILALKPPPSTRFGGGDGVCALDDNQLALIRSAIATNASVGCSYNMTVADILK